MPGVSRRDHGGWYPVSLSKPPPMRTTWPCESGGGGMPRPAGRHGSGVRGRDGLRGRPGDGLRGRVGCAVGRVGCAVGRVGDGLPFGSTLRGSDPRGTDPGRLTLARPGVRPGVRTESVVPRSQRPGGFFTGDCVRERPAGV